MNKNSFTFRLFGNYVLPKSHNLRCGYKFSIGPKAKWTHKKHAVLLFSIIYISLSLSLCLFPYKYITHNFIRGQPLLFEPSHFISFFKSVAFSSRIWNFYKNKLRNYTQSLFLNAKDVKWNKKCWPKEKLNKTANENSNNTNIIYE